MPDYFPGKGRFGKVDDEANRNAKSEDAKELTKGK
jgi:hypothetical protein